MRMLSNFIKVLYKLVLQLRLNKISYYASTILIVLGEGISSKLYSDILKLSFKIMNTHIKNIIWILKKREVQYTQIIINIILNINIYTLVACHLKVQKSK